MSLLHLNTIYAVHLKTLMYLAHVKTILQTNTQSCIPHKTRDQSKHSYYLCKRKSSIEIFHT